ncbi:YybH family protein [Aquimarina hainanensis]|uniref:YybH family protein n=1 Tax=Aquimarina hainanensis TaxID=1578017 RepID=A0ABW5N2S8_9FLAO
MKRIKMITTALLTGLFFTPSFGQEETKEIIPQSYQEHSPTKHHEIALEVLKASEDWIETFNKGNAAAYVKDYDSSAIMNVIPHGVKIGTEEISEFWTPFIQSGATNLVYTNVSIEVVNETTAFLSANFSMNVGHGIIYQEKWKKIEGKWLLTYDNSEVLDQFETPQENTTNPVASHIILEEVIKASISWTMGFNSGKKEVCGNGYSDNATMNAVPFATENGKGNIEAFWGKLITDGATNLTYHNPIFTIKTDNSVFLSSQWSMNIGEGKIYQEKWEKVDGTWLLTYDEFEVLKQY